MQIPFTKPIRIGILTAFIVALIYWDLTGNQYLVAVTQAFASTDNQILLLVIGYVLLFVAFAVRHQQLKRYQMEYENLHTQLAQLQKTIQASYAELDLARQRADSADEQKSRFLADMSHEIRTPLNAIIGFTELLLMSCRKTDQAYLQNIHQSGCHLLELINDILDLSQLESTQNQLQEDYCELPRLITEIVNLSDVQNHNADVELKMHIDKSAWFKIYIDQRRLKQILINLIANAIKYTQNGYVSIDVRLQEESQTHTLEVSICDTGPGMTQQQVERIAEPFQRFKCDETGTGLGMTITFHLIQLMKGTIDISSKLSEGTRVKLRLPLSEKAFEQVTTSRLPDSRVADTQPDYNVPINLPGPVLVVDDQPMNLDLIGRYLDKLNIAYDCCLSGSEALICCQDRLYSLILLDLRMPVIDGLETCQLIRQAEKKQGRLVALTAQCMNHDKPAIEKAGFDDYLTKPLSLATLRALCLDISQNGLSSENIIDTPIWFDWNSLLDKTGQDQGIAIDLTKQLVDALPDMIHAITAEQSDAQVQADLLHRWSGLLRYCGAENLGKQLTDIETQIRTTNLVLTADTIEKLSYKLQTLLVQAFQHLRKVTQTDLQDNNLAQIRNTG